MDGIGSLSFESTGMEHFRVVVVVFVAMVVRTRFSRFFFDGVSLSQKHTDFCKIVYPKMQVQVFRLTPKGMHDFQKRRKHIVEV